MYNRNRVKVRIADTVYYLRNARYYFNKGDTGRCTVYLSSVKAYIKDTINAFKKF